MTSFSGGFCLTHTDTEVRVKGEILEEVRKEVKQVDMREDQVVPHATGRPVGGGPTGHVRRCVLYESASTVWPFSRAAEGWGVECWPASGEGPRQLDQRRGDGGEPLIDEEVGFVGVPGWQEQTERARIVCSADGAGDRTECGDSDIGVRP